MKILRRKTYPTPYEMFTPTIFIFPYMKNKFNLLVQITLKFSFNLKKGGVNNVSVS